MDYEKKYKEALKLAVSYYGNGTNEFLDTIFPELKESEDERITRAINNMLPFIPDEAYANNGVTKESVLNWLEKQKINTEGDFGRGYNCGYEACLNSHGAEWFEKQKEQKPVEIYEPSYDELQRHQDELHNFKVFAAKQAKEHHIRISFVHDFEWNNFCAEILSYFNEQKPADNQFPPLEGLDAVKAKYYDEGFKNGFDEGVDSVKPAEWSDEDKEIIETICKEGDLKPSEVCWLKSLRPSWKPSEEQMEALERASTNKYLSAEQYDILVSLCEQLKKL